MKDKTEKFERLLARFRFTQPATAEMKKRISRNKRKQFAIVLKKTGGYSVSFGVVASLFFALKKLGMGVSIVKTVIILATVTTTAAGLIIVGVYAAAHHGAEQALQRMNTHETGEEPRIREMKVPVKLPDRRESPEIISGRIGVHGFVASDAAKKTALEATDAMVRELARIRGEEFTVDTRTNNDAKRYRMLLTGSVELRNGKYAVTARVSDVGDSRVIFYSSEEAASEEQIPASCQKLARKIARDIPAGNK